jgi:prefoldin subunit 5
VARRLEGQAGGEGGPAVRQLESRLEALETDLEDVNRSLAGMREELQFVQRLLEDPTKKKNPS